VIVENPTLADLFQAIYPDVDVGTPGFALQLLFMQFGTIFIGLAAATLVGGWASDESEGRLEMPLATAVTRARWFLASGFGVYLAIVLTAAVVALITALAVPAGGTAGDG
jgi:putative exporter of polyketide antibiotics